MLELSTLAGSKVGLEDREGLWEACSNISNRLQSPRTDRTDPIRQHTSKMRLQHSSKPQNHCPLAEVMFDTCHDPRFLVKSKRLLRHVQKVTTDADVLWKRALSVTLYARHQARGVVLFRGMSPQVVYTRDVSAFINIPP